MKKTLSLLLAAVLCASTLSACGSSDIEIPVLDNHFGGVIDDEEVDLDFQLNFDSESDSGEASDGKTISVVAKGESHAFWQSVKSGAQDAGSKYGYRVTFAGPASESAEDLPSQIDMVQSALDSSTAGLVVATIGEGFTDLLAGAKSSGIPVVQFDSGIWAGDLERLNASGENPVVSSVATSNRAAAAVGAVNLFESLKSEIAASDSYVVGVIQHDQSQTGKDRAQGFMDKLQELAGADSSTKGRLKIELETRDGDQDQAYVTALDALLGKGSKAVFMTNEGVVKQVYESIQTSAGKYDGLKFCGFDAGTSQIQWIKAESGPKLIGSVAQDSYSIGYSAVEQCIFAAEGKTVTEQVDIAGAWYHTGNIDEMISKQLVYEG